MDDDFLDYGEGDGRDGDVLAGVRLDDADRRHVDADQPPQRVLPREGGAAPQLEPTVTTERAAHAGDQPAVSPSGGGASAHALNSRAPIVLGKRPRPASDGPGGGADGPAAARAMAREPIVTTRRSTGDAAPGSAADAAPGAAADAAPAAGAQPREQLLSARGARKLLASGAAAADAPPASAAALPDGASTTPRDLGVAPHAHEGGEGGEGGAVALVGVQQSLPLQQHSSTASQDGGAARGVVDTDNDNTRHSDSNPLASHDRFAEGAAVASASSADSADGRLRGARGSRSSDARAPPPPHRAARDAAAGPASSSHGSSGGSRAGDGDSPHFLARSPGLVPSESSPHFLASSCYLHPSIGGRGTHTNGNCKEQERERHYKRLREERERRQREQEQQQQQQQQPPVAGGASSARPAGRPAYGGFVDSTSLSQQGADSARAAASGGRPDAARDDRPHSAAHEPSTRHTGPLPEPAAVQPPQSRAEALRFEEVFGRFALCFLPAHVGHSNDQCKVQRSVPPVQLQRLRDKHRARLAAVAAARAPPPAPRGAAQIYLGTWESERAAIEAAAAAAATDAMPPAERARAVAEIALEFAPTARCFLNHPQPHFNHGCPTQQNELTHAAKLRCSKAALRMRTFEARYVARVSRGHSGEAPDGGRLEANRITDRDQPLEALEANRVTDRDRESNRVTHRSRDDAAHGAAGGSTASTTAASAAAGSGGAFSTHAHVGRGSSSSSASSRGAPSSAGSTAGQPSSATTSSQPTATHHGGRERAASSGGVELLLATSPHHPPSGSGSGGGSGSRRATTAAPHAPALPAPQAPPAASLRPAPPSASLFASYRTTATATTTAAAAAAAAAAAPPLASPAALPASGGGGGVDGAGLDAPALLVSSAAQAADASAPVGGSSSSSSSSGGGGGSDRFNVLALMGLTGFATTTATATDVGATRTGGRSRWDSTAAPTPATTAAAPGGMPAQGPAPADAPVATDEPAARHPALPAAESVAASLGGSSRQQQQLLLLRGGDGGGGARAAESAAAPRHDHEREGAAERGARRVSDSGSGSHPHPAAASDSQGAAAAGASAASHTGGSGSSGGGSAPLAYRFSETSLRELKDRVKQEVKRELTPYYKPGGTGGSGSGRGRDSPAGASSSAAAGGLLRSVSEWEHVLRKLYHALMKRVRKLETRAAVAERKSGRIVLVFSKSRHGRLIHDEVHAYMAARAAKASRHGGGGGGGSSRRRPEGDRDSDSGSDAGSGGGRGSPASG